MSEEVKKEEEVIEEVVPVSETSDKLEEKEGDAFSLILLAKNYLKKLRLSLKRIKSLALRRN